MNREALTIHNDPDLIAIARTRDSDQISDLAVAEVVLEETAEDAAFILGLDVGYSLAAQHRDNNAVRLFTIDGENLEDSVYYSTVFYYIGTKPDMLIQFSRLDERAAPRACIS